MPITCQLCLTQFDKIIPWQHLRNAHQVTTGEYKEKYGSLYSAETLAKHSTRVPHNKGTTVTDPVILATIREATVARELRFKNGEFTRGSAKTEEQKQLLSQRAAEYALANPEKMKTRAQTAISTKKIREYDFGSPMRGKRHSADTLEKISAAATASNQTKSQQANSAIAERILALDLTLINDITEHALLLLCNTCQHQFSITKQYFTPSKIKDTICPHCYPRTVTRSKGEVELFDYVYSLIPEAVHGYKVNQKYHSKEIDIFVPTMNIGFEYNGLYYHSEQVLLANGRSPVADYEKKKSFAQQGITIIPIFEDEWSEQPGIVKSRIANILGKTNSIIYARKCTVREVSSHDAAIFCKLNHSMGSGRSNIRLGLYLDNNLVSLMTFTNNNISRKSNVWEINRFASLLDVSVVGGASKLFKAFISRHEVTEIISYSDNRWSDGGLYKTLGFTKVSDGTPNYWYVKPNTGRIHRFNLRKTSSDNQELTEVENRIAQGYLRIWDCGSSKWSWVKS